MRGQRLGTHPRLGHRTSPRSIDHSDRDSERLMQLAGEKVTGGGEVGNRPRRAGLPASAYDLYIFPRSQTGNPLDAEQTYPRPVGAFDLAGIIAHAAPSSYRHLHIGLPRADPHLADQHVLQRNGLPVRNGNRIRSSRVGSFQLQHPFSVRSATGSDGRSVPRPGHRHLGPRFGPAPKRRLALPLQNHVAAENGSQTDFGLQQTARHQSQTKNTYFFQIHLGSFLSSAIKLAIPARNILPPGEK